MKRLPRKLKKELKKKFYNRYKCKWLGTRKNQVIEEYYWFYKNPFHWNMDECIK
jgi:hypothetical protein